VTTLCERSIDGAPYTVALDQSGDWLRVSVFCTTGPRFELDCHTVYMGEDGGKALDAFRHPFAREHVPNLWERS